MAFFFLPPQSVSRSIRSLTSPSQFAHTASSEGLIFCLVSESIENLKIDNPQINEKNASEWIAAGCTSLIHTQERRMYLRSITHMKKEQRNEAKIKDSNEGRWEQKNCNRKRSFTACVFDSSLLLLTGKILSVVRFRSSDFVRT
mmetsp:Transcript_13234/g.26106  ORF Transcript_13234/g.26106 Transcript_13234/m.26106 type:complete len:144 (+) Transcript_13234:1137-1568(+)